MIHRYLTLRQVAEAMGISPASLYAKVTELEERHGFPKPAPGMGKLRDAVAIEAWQRRQLAPELRLTRTVADDVELASEIAELDRQRDVA